MHPSCSSFFLNHPSHISSLYTHPRPLPILSLPNLIPQLSIPVISSIHPNPCLTHYIVIHNISFYFLLQPGVHKIKPLCSLVCSLATFLSFPVNQPHLFKDKLTRYSSQTLSNPSPFYLFTNPNPAPSPFIPNPSSFYSSQFPL